MTTATPPFPTSCALTLRPVVAADADAMQAFVVALGGATRRFRFHGTVNGCAPGLLRQLTDVDGRRHVAFVACAGEAIVGEARFFASADGRDAEFAIAVADAFQGKGVAGALMDLLVDAARAAGIARLYGDVLDDNQRMAAFMRRRGFEIDLGLWDLSDASLVRWQRVVRRPRVRLGQWRLPSLPRLAARFAGRGAALQ